MKKFKIIPVMLTLLFLTFSLHANTENNYQNKNAAKELAARLQQKVLLNDSQTAKVESLIDSFINNPDMKREDFKKDVKALLDERQSVKFNIINEDWVREVEKHRKN